MYYHHETSQRQSSNSQVQTLRDGYNSGRSYYFGTDTDLERGELVVRA